MSGPNDSYPRAVFDAHGTYTVRTGASYCVEDSRVRELAEIGYALRDVAKAYDFLACCLDENDGERPGECEESLWVAAVVFYAKPFGRNDARGAFDANAFLNARLSDEGRRLHEYLRRLRHRWAAHDDGLGEDKTVAIYLPPSPPRSILEIGMYGPARRVISLGTDLARQLEPHVAWVRDELLAHENERREAIARELIATRFDGLRLTGIATSTPLAVDIDSVLALPKQWGKRRTHPPEFPFRHGSAQVAARFSAACCLAASVSEPTSHGYGICGAGLASADSVTNPAERRGSAGLRTSR